MIIIKILCICIVFQIKLNRLLKTINSCVHIFNLNILIDINIDDQIYTHHTKSSRKSIVSK